MPKLPVVAMLLFVAACSGPNASDTPAATDIAAPSASPAPSVIPTIGPAASASQSPTLAPTIAPTPAAASTVTLPEFQFVNHFVMRVAVNDLNVRRKPDTSGASKGKAKKGELFMVYDWPITADGYTWYFGFQQLQDNNVVPTLPQAYNEGYDEILAGWIAAGTADTPFLIPVGARCPTTHDVANLSAMLDSEHIDCMGTEPFLIAGTFSNDGCGGEAPGTFDPQWLAFPLECSRLEPDSQDGVPLYLHFAPGGPPLPAEGARVRVRAHYSDERSGTCRITVLADDGSLTQKIANGAAEQWCDGRLVVDDVEVIG
ncbi:MAG TPA: hypothetical protein VJ850_03545 [Candidatus Limnocylindrales bacterium]|nr:hypothetical protein [Candidatus Limnocylindrales bacterium]